MPDETEFCPLCGGALLETANGKHCCDCSYYEEDYMRTQLLSDAVREVLREFPNHPTKTLARILAEREPVLFRDVEAARRAVRYLRGNIGQGNRGSSTDKNFFRPNGKQSDGVIPLPAPVDTDTWQVVTVGFKRALIIADVHIPFHDLKALKLALDYGKKFSVDAIIINGDLFDFYRISAWEKDPRARSFASEVERPGNCFWNICVRAFRKHKSSLRKVTTRNAFGVTPGNVVQTCSHCAIHLAANFSSSRH